MRGLGHVRSADLDPKKQKRSIKVDTSLIVGPIALVVIQIVPDPSNVSVLKIERKSNMIEAGIETDIVQGLIVTPDLMLHTILSMNQCLHKFQCQ